jgi:uncharacterized protein YjbI with pentapeptide repeats
MALNRDSHWAKLLHDGNVEEFNRLAENEVPDLHDTDLRMLDLRGANLKRADMRGAYLRNADLRGLDLSEARLDGASLHDARVSGVLFPTVLDANEIRFSIGEGTRLRTRPS